jgi:hypothetical protein
VAHKALKGLLVQVHIFAPAGHADACSCSRQLQDGPKPRVLLTNLSPKHVAAQHAASKALSADLQHLDCRSWSAANCGMLCSLSLPNLLRMVLLQPQ